MDFFSILLSDPVVAASIAVITATCSIVSYLAYYFIKNILNANPPE